MNLFAHLILRLAAVVFVCLICAVGLVPIPDWETMATMKVISPGVCITFAPGQEAPRRLCSQLETISDPAPAWFEAFYDRVFGGYARVERPLTSRQPMAGLIAAEPDRGAAVRQAWHQ